MPADRDSFGEIAQQALAVVVLQSALPHLPVIEICRLPVNSPQHGRRVLDLRASSGRVNAIDQQVEAQRKVTNSTSGIGSSSSRARQCACEVHPVATVCSWVT